MKKIIIFNWKMNPDFLGEAKRIFSGYGLRVADCGRNLELVVVPPFVYLSEFKNSRSRLGFGGRVKTKKLKNLKLGAQNVFWENPRFGGGAYTGEISVKMLKNLGVEYVIVGHSERRRYLGETDEMVNKKVLAALKGGLKVILCVGEGLSIRRAGKKAVEKFIKNQLQKDLKNILLNFKSYILNSRLAVAYEPLWAIGTGHSDTPEDAVEIIKFINKWLNVKCQKLKVKVLYGGSVDSKNIADFLKHSEIDGALIGHASLKAAEIKKIISKVAEF